MLLSPIDSFLEWLLQLDRWQKFRTAPLRLGTVHSCRFRIAAARTLNCLHGRNPFFTTPGYPVKVRHECRSGTRSKSMDQV